MSSLVSRARGASAPGAFYGWRMVGLAAVCLAMTAPGQTVGVSVFIDPMAESLNLTRSQVSAAYLVGTLTGAVALPAVGLRVDRLGIRRVTAIVGAAFGVVLLAMSGVSGFLTLLLGFVGIRILGQGALSLTATTSVTLWFDRRRGLAVGVSSAGGQALMSLAPLVLAAVIATVGWRRAWIVAAVVVWAVLLPLARWALQDSPAKLGQDLDGAQPDRKRAHRPTPSWTRTEAMRSSMFWVVTAAVATSGMIGTGLSFHQISLLGERGLSVSQAAANFVPQTLAGIAGTLAMGAFFDRVAPRLLVSASMTSLAGAMLLVQVAAPGWRAVAFGIVIGVGGGAIRALEAAAFPRFYGLANIGTIRGLVMALNVGASAFGPLALALGYDLAGSYGPALHVLLPIPVAIAVAAVFATVPNERLLQRIRRRSQADSPPAGQ